jgi:hypothetical protein
MISIAALAGLSFLVAGDLSAPRPPMAKTFLLLAAFSLAGLESLVVACLVSLPLPFVSMSDNTRMPHAVTAATTWFLAASSGATALSLLVLGAVEAMPSARKRKAGAGG